LFVSSCWGQLIILVPLYALASAPSTTEVEAIAVLETLVLQIMHESFEGFV
jgi:hypothetical protein